MFGAVDWYGTLSTDSDIDRFIELLDSIEGFGPPDAGLDADDAQTG